MMNMDLQQLEVLIESLLSEHGYKLFECTLKHSKGTANIDVLIDKPAGGISLEACGQINRHIVKKIDEEGFYGDDYTLNVSSPGLDRPLKLDKDFCRVLGETVEMCYLKTEREEYKVIGKLISVDQGRVVLETDAGKENILIKQIKKAVLMI